MDISMCQYDACPKKDTCLRYMSQVDPLCTSYVFFKAICNEKSNFQWFVTIGPKDTIRKVNIDE